MDINEQIDNVKHKVAVVRIRTWTLTASIVAMIVLYYLVNVVLQSKMNIVDFVFLALIQIIAHCLYFPDGELSGKNDKEFQGNRNAYNEKATKINEEHKIGKLREYCKVEFEERCKKYFETQLGLLGLEQAEFEEIKSLGYDKIKKLKLYEFKSKDKITKTMLFNKKKRKILLNLIYKPIPVKPNNPETIMSALENDGSRAIRDESINYKVGAYIRKFLQAVLLGGFLAYVGFMLKESIDLTDIVKICMYICSMFSTAVMSFGEGEKCIKVYKKNFYIELSTFIDGFNEWQMSKTSGNK